MSDKPDLPRTVRGKRPTFFDTPGVDEAFSMIMTLAQETWVLRDRLDAAERVMAGHGIDLAGGIESLKLDEAALKEREAARNAFYDRLFFIFAQQRAEVEQRTGGDAYDETLEKIARGDI
ncbi:hypothetical protein [Croceicoccus gelatinilyticus]|uniref:hypothetical protein n=1 Tax=Croceicoccus gelatinilyticus TaxID=2835536 RepID=UPI001BCF3014|nr:hypothetical protein [Croceicoccus gelatinilyticus]MBS7669041.1 hypothetical protein [Croceicoccus gelatinilyticus]